jgi:hypothetical protein
MPPKGSVLAMQSDDLSMHFVLKKGQRRTLGGPFPTSSNNVTQISVFR